MGDAAILGDVFNVAVGEKAARAQRVALDARGLHLAPVDITVSRLTDLLTAGVVDCSTGGERPEEPVFSINYCEPDKIRCKTLRFYSVSTCSDLVLGLPESADWC
jgi:hypothetical protein